MSSLVILELRCAFKSCARQRAPSIIRYSLFSTLRPLQKRKGQTSSVRPSKSLDLTSRPERTPTAQRGPTQDAPKPTSRPSFESTDMTAPSRDPRSVGSGRKVEVPMKVMPKSQITPELELTPKERMQLEYITRRLPKRAPGKVFRERLLIYHGGLTRQNWRVFLKVTTMVVMSFTLAVVAPAYYTYGVPWWTVASIIFIGCSPFFLINWRTRPYVTWIHLILPTFARQSPKAALEYARNLPDNARLQLHFMRASALPANVIVQMSDLAPTRSIWRPITFEWVGRRVDKGWWLRPNPTQFYVRPKSGTGKEARDTIPGIWEAVYKRIMGAESSEAAKWRK